MKHLTYSVLVLFMLLGCTRAAVQPVVNVKVTVTNPDNPPKAVAHTSSTCPRFELPATTPPPDPPVFSQALMGDRDYVERELTSYITRLKAYQKTERSRVVRAYELYKQCN